MILTMMIPLPKYDIKQYDEESYDEKENDERENEKIIGKLYADEGLRTAVPRRR